MHPSTSSVALAHHWLVGMRGGEKVLEQFSLLFPGAPIYTMVARPARLSAALRGHPLRVAPFGHLPGASRLYKQALPLFPLIIRQLRVAPPARLVLSSDASMIKGLGVPPGAIHVCYCHSPPRYLWDQQETYATAAGPGMRLLRLLTPALRRWDRAAAQRVDHFIANSKFVQARIQTAYGRTSTVIYPPVAVQDFTPQAQVDDFYLIVSQLVPYKRVDLAVEAFTHHRHRRLIIIGDGPERRRLQQQAGPNIQFLGPQPFPVLRDHYARCRALVFPGIEDFGITPLEAQASGRPVIAYAAGGVLETVLPGETGILFPAPTAASLLQALTEFEAQRWDPAACQRQAHRFGEPRFRQEIAGFLAAHQLPCGPVL